MARITAIMESLQKIQEKTTIEEENTQSNTLLWDKNARETLQLVTSLGYDELGQDNLDALIQGLRVRDGKK